MDNLNSLMEDLKTKIIAHLNLQDIAPDDIAPDDSLFNSGLGLDSIDALELIVLLQQEYGLKITSAEEGKKVFTSLRTMAQFVADNQQTV
jgi:acyl carrier protein